MQILPINQPPIEAVNTTTAVVMRGYSGQGDSRGGLATDV